MSWFPFATSLADFRFPFDLPLNVSNTKHIMCMTPARKSNNLLFLLVHVIPMQSAILFGLASVYVSLAVASQLQTLHFIGGEFSGRFGQVTGS